MSVGFDNNNNFKVNESLLKKDNVFGYLGFSLTKCTNFDHEVTLRIRKASTALDRQTKQSLS